MIDQDGTPACWQDDIIQNGIATLFQPTGKYPAGAALSDITPESGRCQESNDQY